MLHKSDKDLPTIISHGKGVRIILERDRLASILGILDNGNTITIGTKRRRKEEGVDPPSEEDRLRDRSTSGFRPIEKTTRSSIGASSSQPCKDNEDDEEDETGAQNTIPMNAFQTEM
ncbi:hypothetical protein M9H77_07245 [Catharanthus roseus]|uniref:Uncharacterized protein n=1 Tax=Catharanthus roseus TaxID=4058 RepID=A0ACC0BUD0_CATRO|nr:hypothetical protein M9H77_07245 [Catharanthus roseus]